MQSNICLVFWSSFLSNLTDFIYLETTTWLNSGLKTTTGDPWKPVAIETNRLWKFWLFLKKAIERNTKWSKNVYFKTLSSNAVKSLFTFNLTGKTTCKNCCITLEISNRIWLSSIKTHHPEKLLNVLFWSWKQWIWIIK